MNEHNLGEQQIKNYNIYFVHYERTFVVDAVSLLRSANTLFEVTAVMKVDLQVRSDPCSLPLVRFRNSIIGASCFEIFCCMDLRIA